MPLDSLRCFTSSQGGILYRAKLNRHRSKLMKFLPTPLKDAWVIELEPSSDARGAFSRTFCEREFASNGLETRYPQHSVSYSRLKATLRGMHYQRAPHEEAKLVRCIRGSVYDVIIDARPASPTYGRWAGFELTAKNGRQLYVPQGFAHGFQTLEDDSELSYLISAFYSPDAASGYRYDDEAFAIKWPLPVSVIAEKDLAWPRFRR